MRCLWKVELATGEHLGECNLKMMLVACQRLLPLLKIPMATKLNSLRNKKHLPEFRIS